MPLLAHNITENFKSQAQEKETSCIYLEEGNDLILPIPPCHDHIHPCCPASHLLTPVTADCEDYMCNVCDFDIDEDSCIHRCVDCNFDICDKCMSKVSSGDTAAFPPWFRLQLQSQATLTQQGSRASSSSSGVIPFVYDWGDRDTLNELVRAVEGEDNSCVRYLVGADVTYSMQSIDLFFAAVVELKIALHVKSSASSSFSSDSKAVSTMTLLFAHHNRSDDTNDYMMQQLHLKFDGKFEEIPFEALSCDDREESDAPLAATGEMKIFKVIF
jgi:hypothetical protein